MSLKETLQNLKWKIKVSVYNKNIENLILLAKKMSLLRKSKIIENYWILVVMTEYTLKNIVIR